MKMKPEENETQSASIFKNRDFNSEIGETLIEKMRELDLLPCSKDDLGFRYVQYFPNDQLLDWTSKIARKIVRERPEVKLEDLLTNEEKELILDVAKGKSEGTQFQSSEVIQEFERVGLKRGLRINRRWYFRCREDDLMAIMPLTPYGYAAQMLFFATLWKDNNDPHSNYPRRSLELLKTPLRNITKFSSFNIPSPNTHEDVKWRYIDQINGGIMPPIELCKERLNVLRELNLLPDDPHFWLMVDGGSKERQRQYKEKYLPEVNRLKKEGVPAEVFDKLQELWFGEGFRDADKKGEKINQTFFFIAYLLKEDYPGLYNWYLREVKSFVFERLISKSIHSLKREKNDLEKKLERQKFQEDMRSEYTSGVLSKQTTSSVINVGLRIKRRKELASNEIRESDDLKGEQDQLEDIKQRYEQKQREWKQEILMNEAEISKFKAWLKQDFLLGCVFFSYVLDGFKKLKLERERHRPSNKILGHTIVHLVDNLTPYFKASANERENKRQLYSTVSRLLSGLTWQKLANKTVKDTYYRYSHKFTK
jgi:hypothetical protein